MAIPKPNPDTVQLYVDVYAVFVYGTKAALILSKEEEMTIVPNKEKKSPSGVKVSAAAGPTLDTQATAPMAVAKA